MTARCEMREGPVVREEVDVLCCRRTGPVLQETLLQQIKPLANGILKQTER